MTAAGSVFYPLPPRASLALEKAILELHQLWREDLETLDALVDSTEATRTTPATVELHMRDSLPPNVCDALKPGMAWRLYISLTLAGWKLCQPFKLLPSCLAEELCLHAIIERAQALLKLELTGTEADQAELDTAGTELQELYFFAFDDDDFRDMFDPALDGIDTSPGGQILGYSSLSVADLFAPFLHESQRGVLHPVVASNFES